MKDLVRTRHQTNVYYRMVDQLKSLGFQLSIFENSTTVNSVLSSVSKILGNINGTMDVRQVTKVIKEFGRQRMLIEANQDMVKKLITLYE